LLKRSIDAESFGPTIEERVFVAGKRLAVFCAVAAVSISALDLMYAGTLESAASFIRDGRLHYAEMPDRILTGIRQISIIPSEPSVTIAIPRDAAVKANIASGADLQNRPAAKADSSRLAMRPPAAEPSPALLAAKASLSRSAVASLADFRSQDAVEFAMGSSSANESLPMGALALAPATQVNLGASEVGQVRLASLGGGMVPADNAGPSPSAVSLPMSEPIPLDLVPMPVPAPGVPPPSPAQRLKLEGKEYAKAERCLANAIYWEARSEPIRGQMAVAQVVMNRVFSPFYPNDVCSVVYQNAHRHLSCQFTFACDGKRKVITERGHWARANRIAKQTLDGQIYVPEVAKSTHYHAAYVNPIWNREMRKMVRFGLHSFYRPYAWGNGADQPAWGKTALASTKKH
jgi:hypothetical protein